jgi:hypothetical protein
MATEGIVGLYVETRNYGATGAFWSALGYRNAFETGHGSGQWEHPRGGPYVFVAEQHSDPLRVYPILGVADAERFDADHALDVASPFTAQHWDVVESLVNDPDGRVVSLQAPIPPGMEAPDADAHHGAKYGA